MPVCLICSDYFSGSGRYCAFHRQSSSSAVARYRSSHDDHHHHKPNQLQRYGNHNYNYNYDDSTLGLYNTPRNNTPFFSPLPMSSAKIPNNPTLQSTVSALTHLSAHYAIDTLTLTTHADHTTSLTIAANKARIQCPVCRTWFPDPERLQAHRWELPSGCALHSVCFKRSEELFHGTSFRHERCFVEGCGSVYRRAGGWKGGVVEGHVREWHGRC